MSIEACVQAERQRLQQEHAALPLFEQREIDLRAQVDAVPPGPLQLRRAAPLRRALRDCTRQVQRLRDQVPQRQFETRIGPFLAAAQSKLHRAQDSSDDQRRLPGSRKRQKTEGLSQYIRTQDGALYGSMLQEYKIEFLHQSPEVIIDCSAGHCSRCDVEYVFVDRKSQATCPRCGQTKPYLEATTASLTYHTEVEFNMFSYKVRPRRA
jgi:hypothetical protein